MGIINAFFTSILTIILFIVVLFIIGIIILSKIKNKNKSKVSQKEAKNILISKTKIIYDNKEEAFKDENISFFEFKKKLNFILEDEKIEKIIIDLDEFSLSFSEFEEVEEIFKKLRDQKEIIAIGSVFTNESYLTGLLANKIYMVNTKNSYLLIQGYKKKLPYYKKLLDKLGIKVKVLHVGDFKAYGENYKLEEMSDNLKKDLTRLSDSRLNYFINKVIEYRGIDITNDLIDGNIFLKNDYKGLIDKKVNKYEYIEKDEYLMNIDDYEIKLSRKKKKEIKNLDKSIAIITLEGGISNKGINFKEVYNKVKLALKIEDLVGVILEINSPGGSAYESSLIHTMLRKEFKGIPIFVSMKDVCASGGYFIASSSIKIFANKNTLTGSIGVVSMYPNFEELVKKVGINFSGVEKGDTPGSFFEELSEKSEDLLQNQIISIYEEFKKVVMRSRIMTDERLEKIAGGRVWTGLEAKENGLVDEIGSLEDTIKALKKYLRIENAKVIHIKKSINFKEEIKNKFSIIGLDNSLLNKPLMMYIEG